MGIDTQLRGIVSLLDDTDEEVIKAINSHLLSKGTPIIDDLNVLYRREKSKDIRARIANKISFLDNEFTLISLKKIAPQKEINLIDGIALISKLVLPEINKDEFENKILSFINDLLPSITEDKQPEELMDIYNHYFFHRLLFKITDITTLHESTLSIYNTINSRNGSAISITLIYFIIARLSGIPIYPLCFKGGLIPVYVKNNKILFYIDIFKKGEIFNEDKLISFFEGQKSDNDSSIIFEVREDRVLTIIYIETLIQFYSEKKKYKIVDILNRAIEYFGDERFLNIESDEEEEDF